MVEKLAEIFIIDICGCPLECWWMAVRVVI
jgi:hypothetical protein